MPGPCFALILQLSKAGFDKCMTRSLPSGVMSEGDRAFLTFALESIFKAFDSDGDGLVDETEFAAGFSMLATVGLV